MSAEGVPVAWALCHVRRGFNDDAAQPKLLFDSPEKAEDVARRHTAFGAGEGARFIVRPVAWFTEPKPASPDVARICDESAAWWKAKADDPTLPHDVRMFALARASGAMEVKAELPTHPAAASAESIRAEVIEECAKWHDDEAARLRERAREVENIGAKIDLSDEARRHSTHATSIRALASARATKEV